MSYFDGFTPTYTFQLRIERDDRIILDTAIAAKGDADGVAKAKKTIQRLLNEYTPVIKPPVQAKDPEPEQTAPALPEPENSGGSAQDPDDDPPVPEETAEPLPPPRTHERPPQGARGVLRLHCRACGNTFGTFLRDYQTEIACRCGQPIDLTAPLAMYRFNCPYCEKESWGRTNLEDPEITVRCKCGGDVDLRWNPKAREYQN